MFSEELLGVLPDKLQNIVASSGYFLPELLLTGGFLLVLLIDLIWQKRSLTFFIPLMLGILSLVGFALYLQINASWVQGKFLFLEMLYLDGLSVFFRLLLVLSVAITVLQTLNSRAFSNTREGIAEYFALLLATLLGLSLLSLSVNLLSIYLSIELISISSYILTAFCFDRKSAEGSLKYLLFGALSSAAMLYGMSWLYGLTGTLNIFAPQFAEHLAEVSPLALSFILLLTLSGLLFKLAIAPFHLWVADIYEAAPSPIAAFFSVAPKAAVLLLLWRFTASFAPDILADAQLSWASLLALLALSSILIGNLAALWQQDVKRLLAYSSIAHAGFLLIALVAYSEFAQQSLLFYLVVYALLNFAAFGLAEALACQQSQAKNPYDLRHYRGLGHKFPLLGVLWLLLMIGLTGLPPTAGFTAKLFIFSALWESYQTSSNIWLLGLLIVGLINTAISLFFYLKIPFYMFFREAENTLPKSTYGIKIYDLGFALALSAPVLLFFFKADLLLNFIKLMGL